MSNYTNLKTAIDAVVKENGRQEITGILLNQTLIAMVNSLGTGYQFMGVATPSTNPGTPDQKVFYIASQLGTYSNFNGIFLGRGIFVLKWDSAWSYETIIAFDATPTVGSNNPIISGAVYTLTQIYVTRLVNDLVNYYRKDETYTQAEIQQIIATIKQFTYETVSSLPTASSATMYKIYLVPSADPQQQNIRDEYITIRESSLIVFVTEAEQQTYGFVKRYWASENKGQHLIGFFSDGSGYTPISDTPTGYTPQEGDIIIEYSESGSNILFDADENGTISAQGVPVASRWDGTRWVNIDSTLGDEYYSKFDNTVSYILTKNDWAIPTAYPEDDPRNVNGIIEQVLYRWEQIGSTAIDLSNYYTKTQTEAVANQLINLALQAYTNTTDLNALLAQKQDTLVSGTNIKTINGQSIVGSGNIDLTTIKFAVASRLPTASSSTLNKIYLIPSENPDKAAHNIKDEYVTLQNEGTPMDAFDNVYFKPTGTPELPSDISVTSAILTQDNGKAKLQVYTGSSLVSTSEPDRGTVVYATGENVYYKVIDPSQGQSQTASDWEKVEKAWVQYFWELIGSTAIDLSNYYTKTQTEAVANQLINLALQAYTNTTDLNALLAQKQDTLVSGTNIKTINGQSIVGSGNINIDTTVFEFANTLPNPDTAAKNKIYLIPSSDPDAAAQNIKDEYVAVPRTVIYNDVQYPVTLMDSEEIRNVVVLGYMAPVPDASAANVGTLYLHQTNTPPSTTDRINTDGSLILSKEVYTNVFSNVNQYVKIGDAYTVESGANAGIWIRTKTGTNVGWVKVETYYVWELVGSTQINLEDYYTKSEVDALVETEPVANADKLNNIMLMFDLPKSQNSFYTTDNNKHYFYVQPPKSANIDNAAMFADWLVGSSPYYHLSVTTNDSTVTFTYNGDNTFVINADNDPMLEVTCTKIDENVYQCEVVAVSSSGPGAWKSFEIV